MKTSRTLLALAVATALTACAGPAPTGDPVAAPDAGVATTSAPPAAERQPSVGEEAQVEETFRRYYEALLGRDYRTACEINAPETTSTLIETLTTQGVTVGTCEEAYSTVYAIPGAAETADRTATGTRIQGVAVDGDTATVSWSAEAQGQRRTVDSGFRRLDGRWRLLSATP